MNPKATAVLGLAGLAIFVLIAALVQLRLLSPADYAIALSMQHIGNPALDWWAALAGNLASAELSVVYAVVIALALRRMGAGLWALAPFAFLVPTAMELALKSWVTQPPVPPELQFHLPERSNLPSIALEGSFPSGHSLRSSFFGTFLAVLIWPKRWSPSTLLAMVILAIAPAIGFAMLYAAWHWTSDVVAGLLLGASVALLVAPPVATRLKVVRPAK